MNEEQPEPFSAAVSSQPSVNRRAEPNRAARREVFRPGERPGHPEAQVIAAISRIQEVTEGRSNRIQVSAPRPPPKDTVLAKAGTHGVGQLLPHRTRFSSGVALNPGPGLEKGVPERRGATPLPRSRLEGRGGICGGGDGRRARIGHGPDLQQRVPELATTRAVSSGSPSYSRHGPFCLDIKRPARGCLRPVGRPGARLQGATRPGVRWKTILLPAPPSGPRRRPGPVRRPSDPRSPGWPDRPGEGLRE